MLFERPKKKGVIHVAGEQVTITPEMVTIEKVDKKISGRTFIPHVIEPSFGIGRIIYCTMEHAFNTRESRRILSFPPHIAPLKCSVLPLMDKPQLTVFVTRIVSLLTAADISSKVDTVQSIGRRYARTDEIGIPFALTIDYTTIQDDTVTLRDRDNTSQIRVKIDEIPDLVNSLIRQRTTWNELKTRYPIVERVQDETEESDKS